MRLIDADALMKWANDHYDFEVYTVGYISNLIKDMPTVEAEPVRHGKWTRENNYGIWKCNVCGCKVNRSNPLKGNIWNYYYCPNCGAKMERKEE